MTAADKPKVKRPAVATKVELNRLCAVAVENGYKNFRIEQERTTVGDCKLSPIVGDGYAHCSKDDSADHDTATADADQETLAITKMIEDVEPSTIEDIEP